MIQDRAIVTEAR